MDQSETLQRSVKLAHRNGLHIRPIQQLVRAVSDYEADVRISFAGKVANAKSAMDLLVLGATFGAELDVEASGVDADSALEKVDEVLGVVPE